jgi:hypothetical protein
MNFKNTVTNVKHMFIHLIPVMNGTATRRVDMECLVDRGLSPTAINA